MGIVFSKLAGAVLLCGMTGSVLAQTAAGAYPSRPVTIISPFAPGGISHMIECFADDGTLVKGSSSEEFGRFLAGEIARWKRLAQEFNIKVAEE